MAEEGNPNQPRENERFPRLRDDRRSVLMCPYTSHAWACLPVDNFCYLYAVSLFLSYGLYIFVNFWFTICKLAANPSADIVDRDFVCLMFALCGFSASGMFHRNIHKIRPVEVAGRRKLESKCWLILFEYLLIFQSGFVLVGGIAMIWTGYREDVYGVLVKKHKFELMTIWIVASVFQLYLGYFVVSFHKIIEKPESWTDGPNEEGADPDARNNANGNAEDPVANRLLDQAQAVASPEERIEIGLRRRGSNASQQNASQSSTPSRGPLSEIAERSSQE